MIIYVKVNRSEIHVFRSVDQRSKFLDPLIRDPYELRFTEVQRSRIPGASEGIFTKQEFRYFEIKRYIHGTNSASVCS